MELVLGSGMGMEMEFGQSEHIFRHEDVHWGPGYSADTRWEMERRMERREEAQSPRGQRLGQAVLVSFVPNA